MATLTAVTSPSQAGLSARGRLYQDNVDANNSTTNVIHWHVPGVARRYQVMDISVETLNVATVHDIDADGEHVYVALRDAANDNYIWAALLIPITKTPVNAKSWAGVWNTGTEFISVSAADILEFNLPAADDSGTPTGDYRVRVTLREILSPF